MSNLPKYTKVFSTLFLLLKKLIKLDKYKIDDEPLVYIANELNITECKTQTSQLAVKILPDKLIMAKGCYFFQNKIFNINSEGLARFILPNKNNQQRIVYAGNIKCLMSSLAWIASHGEKDNHLAFKDLLQQAKVRKLILTCESLVRFAYQLLAEIGVQSRIIGARTLDKWNSYDNGHYLLEVYHPELSKWVLYDLDNDSCFLANKKMLSLVDFIDVINIDYDIHYISADIRANILPQKNTYDYAFITEARLINLKSWYKRIMQMVYIEDKNKYYSYTHINNQLFPRGAFPRLEFLDKELFVKEFYRG